MKCLYVPVMICFLMALPAVAQWSRLQGPTGGAVYGFYEEDTVVYASTASGIYFSVDNGYRWSQIKSELPADIWRCKLLYKKDSIFFLELTPNIDINTALYRSSDYGQTFTKVMDSSSSYSIAIIRDTIFLARAYFHNRSSSDKRSLLTSTDRGLTWSDRSSPEFKCSFVTSDGHSLYAITTDTLDAWQTLRRSFTNGYSWDTLRGAPVVDFSWGRIYPDVIEVQNGEGESVLWVSYYSSQSNNSKPTLYYVKDSEDSLVAARFPLHDTIYRADKLVRLLHARGDVMYAATRDAIYTYKRKTMQWENISYDIANNSLEGWQIWDLYSSPDTTLDYLLVSLPWHRGIARLDSNEQSYHLSDSGLTLAIIDNLTMMNDTLYAVCPSKDQHLFFSPDHGEHWYGSGYKQSIHSGINALVPTPIGLLYADNDTLGIMSNMVPWFSRSFSQEINQFDKIGDTIYGRAAVDYFRTTNNGLSWYTRTKAPLGSLSGARMSTSIGSTLFISGDVLAKSSDGAFSWSIVTTFPYVVDHYWALGADTVNLFTGVTIRHNGSWYFAIFKSTDLGANWQSISPYLPAEVKSIILYPLRNLVLGGLTTGLSVSGHNGEGWRTYTFDNAPVYAICHDSEYVYVGTSGAGIWRARIADLMDYADVEPSQRTETAATLVYPNPATDHITIAESGMLTILNMAGVRLYHSHVTAGDRIDIRFLPEGPYMLRLGTAAPAMLAVE